MVTRTAVTVSCARNLGSQGCVAESPQPRRNAPRIIPKTLQVTGTSVAVGHGSESGVGVKVGEGSVDGEGIFVGHGQLAGRGSMYPSGAAQRGAAYPSGGQVVSSMYPSGAAQRGVAYPAGPSGAAVSSSVYPTASYPPSSGGAAQEWAQKSVAGPGPPGFSFQ